VDDEKTETYAEHGILAEEHRHKVAPILKLVFVSGSFESILHFTIFTSP
jgi:hypothetical protein